VFCGIPTMPQHEKKVMNIKDILCRLDEMKKNGANDLIITGGEPTEHPDLLEIIAEAKRKRINKITMYSQGRNLGQNKLAFRLKENGLTHVMISLFGPTSSIHNQCVGDAKAFDQTIAGLKVARESGLRICLNTTVCSYNIYQLLSMVDLTKEILPSEAVWQLSDLFPTIAVRKRPVLYASYTVIRMQIIEVLRRCAGEGRKCSIQEFPLCVLFPWISDAQELNQGGKTVLLAATKQEPECVKQFRPWRSPYRTFLEDCQQCTVKTKCLGISEYYLKIHPDTSIFQPM